MIVDLPDDVVVSLRMLVKERKDALLRDACGPADAEELGAMRVAYDALAFAKTNEVLGDFKRVHVDLGDGQRVSIAELIASGRYRLCPTCHTYVETGARHICVRPSLSSVKSPSQSVGYDTPGATFSASPEPPEGPLVVDDNGEYTMRADCDVAWIRIKNIGVEVKRTDEGVVVDLWPAKGGTETLGSTYAFDAEGEDEE